MEPTQQQQQRRLIGLNAALIGVLALVTLAGMGGRSSAQPEGRARGEYTILSGTIQGDTADAVYILDSVNQELVALRWDRNGNRLEGIGYRNLAADARVQQNTR